MNPRNLRALRIDDDPFDEQKVGALPPSLDTYSIQDERGSVSAINRWNTALRIWSSVSSSSIPDLVIADVLFAEDDTTPLEGVTQYASHPRFIPTGLSHLKPFAALARALERPLGVAIQTRNPAVWEEAWLKQSHPMAALAAHEIGELAAILGNRIEGETLAERMRSCWLWLKERARDRFDPALYVAMADYRRRLIKATCADRNGVDRGLPPVLVLPQNWAELVSWAAQRSRDGSPAPIPPDLGVQLLYANGGRDHIRLASLFGEVNGITSRRLPARCFSLPEPGADSAPWELDDSGNPKIGAFLQAIGSPTRIAEQAARLVERFSILRHEEDTIYENLIDAAKDLPNRDLTLGLAVLFQVLKWEHARYQAWHKGLEAKGWIPHERRLDESDDRMSLGDFLRTLARFSRHFFCEPFLRADVFESCGRFGLRERDADTGWARWHFDLLVEAGLLTHDSKDDIYTSVGGPFDLFLVPIPAKLPDVSRLHPVTRSRMSRAQAREVTNVFILVLL